jgi:membrane-bound lytic murein transglycosylase D
MDRKHVFIFMILLWFFPRPNAFAEKLEGGNFPSLVSYLEVASPLEFCNEGVPIENEDVREPLEKEMLLTLWNRPQVILWLKRSHRYLPPIEKMLREAGMPEDLKYVAVVESALRPHAGSRKGAIGFWQFIADTGRKYGLVVNARIDERRNVKASTEAAVRYFKDLYDRFGSWTLAVAAFNMGEEGLMAEILEQGTRDYYQLYLPLETQRFLFRIMSTKLIFSDPGKYGFRLSEKDFYSRLSSDEVKIVCFHETPIRIIARAARTYFKVIKDLNPEIRGHYLAPGSHAVLIPKGASAGFQSRYKEYVEKFLAARKEQVYIVREGDNLSSIAERFAVPLPALIIWNKLDLSRPIHPGDKLVIYPKSPRSIETDTEEEDGGAIPDSRGEP